MSVGRGGVCRLIFSDANSVLFEYYAYNSANQLSRRNFDGLMEIKSNCFREPRISKKGKKIIEYSGYFVSEAIKLGHIFVIDSSYCIHKTEGVGSMAFCLCCKIVETYQRTGKVPDEIGIHLVMKER